MTTQPPDTEERKWYQKSNFRPFRVGDVAYGLHKMERELDTLTKEDTLSWIKCFQRDIELVAHTQRILQNRIRELEAEKTNLG